MMRFLARLWLLGPLLLLLAVHAAAADAAEDRPPPGSSEYLPGTGDGSTGEVDCIDCNDDDRDGEGDGSEAVAVARSESLCPSSRLQTSWLEGAAEQTGKQSREARIAHPNRGPPTSRRLAPV